MKKSLTRTANKPYYYKDGKKIEGVHSNIWGDVSDIRGDVSDIWGDVSDIWGDVSGIWGHVSYIKGNLDNCEITAEERAKGIDINDLVK